MKHEKGMVMDTPRIIFAITIAILLGTPSVHCQGEISVDHIQGVVGGGVLVDSKIVFYIRLTNSTGYTVSGISNGFRIYSPDGASWEPWISVDTIFEGPPPSTAFDTTYYTQWQEPVQTNLIWCCGGPSAIFSAIGSRSMAIPAFGTGADTTGLFGFGVGPGEGVGVPDGFSERSWTIQIDRIDASNVGKTVCLDTAMYRNGPNPVEIRWEVDTGLVYPEWKGPRCFTIVDQCCWGTRGNINLDWRDEIDISDLTVLVAWMFKSGAAPPCMLEADVDGNAEFDIQDVTHLVGYMFKNGPEPAACP